MTMADSTMTMMFFDQTPEYFHKEAHMSLFVIYPLLHIFLERL